MDNSKFQINILPAGVGDCIHLRFFSKEKWYNIVIDSGPDKETFQNLLLNIGKNEQVDLLCFTHIDDDHIKGAELFFSSNKEIGRIVKTIWINIPEFEKDRTIPLEPKVPVKTTIKNAVSLYSYIRWFEDHSPLKCKTHIQAGDSIRFGDVEVKAVLPYEDQLNTLNDWWKKGGPQRKKPEKNSTASPDRSVSNRSSIVLRMDACGWKMLFAGDAHAADLCTMALEQKTSFDLVKLPHHGSRSNITPEMLAQLGCRHFIVSADGTHNRPARDTVVLLGEYGAEKGDVTLYNNYDLAVIKKVDHVIPVPLTKKPVSPADDISIRKELVCR